MKKNRPREDRRLAFVTGSRAEYGLLRSVMEAVAGRSGLELQLVVTGMHLLKKFGWTVEEVTRDGWRIDARVRMQKGDDSATDQAGGLARGVAGIARYCVQAGTDIIVVLGDRIEAMAGALAGVTTGCVVAHIHGGDVAPGDFDDSLRHAITKLAHVHLVATQAARRRIIRMGESLDRVHVVGAPGLDRLFDLIRQTPQPRSRSNRALIIQHACGRGPDRERRTMESILHTVEQAGLARTILYPNTDRGHSGILQAIEAHQCRTGADSVQIIRSVDRDRYLRLLIDSAVLVGNSSSGIIEAPVAGTATVNIGPRQAGRQPAGRSVVHAEESHASIRKALEEALRKRPVMGRSTVYGRGEAGKRICGILARVPTGDRFRRKSISY
ncbi:MAG: UDP-N-acetylglucosamine 2-epimerase (hydrolyzing) [Phycisphaerales bacterium]|nr:MAG: UDP-N-acetylglucosamine 2-epimerase (hydrolyzing) [Phycisphaerales bacterium]